MEGQLNEITNADGGDLSLRWKKEGIRRFRCDRSRIAESIMGRYIVDHNQRLGSESQAGQSEPSPLSQYQY